MTIAEKLTTIADNQQKVYEAGKTKEWSDFWDEHQKLGAPIVCSNKFFAWTKKMYKPKYPIIVLENSSSTKCFAYALITDTLVDITFQDGCDVTYCFQSCTILETVRKIICSKTANVGNLFYKCSSLKNVTFEGEIGYGFNVSYSSVITHDSLMSIINHLYDYSGEGGTHTMTFGVTNLAKLSDAEKAVATQKGWTLA